MKVVQLRMSASTLSRVASLHRTNDDITKNDCQLRALSKLSNFQQTDKPTLRSYTLELKNYNIVVQGGPHYSKLKPLGELY